MIFQDYYLLSDEARKLENGSVMPYYTLFYTSLPTGMRRGELLALRWNDIDLDLMTISINRSLQVLKDGTKLIREPKTPKARRLIAMTPTLALELGQYKGEQEKRRLVIGVPLIGDDLVFSNSEGRPINPNTVSPAFSKVAQRIGLKLRFHDLRHTHATLMLKSGAHPKIVSERLGHATVAFTLDTYTHVVPGLQETAARTFDENLLQSHQNSNNLVSSSTKEY